MNHSVTANHLPVVSVCNIRSFFPKQNNWKIDFFEHQVDVSLVCEIWQQTENLKHMYYIEQMLQMEGLQYFSTPRPRGKRGGGAAIIVNKEKLPEVSVIRDRLNVLIFLTVRCNDR